MGLAASRFQYSTPYTENNGRIYTTTMMNIH